MKLKSLMTVPGLLFILFALVALMGILGCLMTLFTGDLGGAAMGFWTTAALPAGLAAWAYMTIRTKERVVQARLDAIDAMGQEFESANVRSVKPRRAALRKGEICIAAAEASLNQIKTVGYKSASAGTSVHVAKGLTLRTGSTRARAVKGLVEVSRGELALTDSRLIFAGDAKSLEIPLSKVINVVPYTDGVGVHVNNAQHTFLINDVSQCVRMQMLLSAAQRGDLTVTAPGLAQADA